MRDPNLGAYILLSQGLPARPAHCAGMLSFANEMPEDRLRIAPAA